MKNKKYEEDINLLEQIADLASKKKSYRYWIQKEIQRGYWNIYQNFKYIKKISLWKTKNWKSRQFSNRTPWK